MRITRRTGSVVVALGLAGATLGVCGLTAIAATPIGVSVLSASDPIVSANLGTAVAMSGATMAVLDPKDEIGSSRQVAVDIYTRPHDGWGSAKQTAKLLYPSSGSSSTVTVAIAGNTVVVGNSEATVGGHNDQGAVYVFVKPLTGWANTSTPIATLTASDGVADDGLGNSVAISGNTIVTGAVGHQVGSNAEQGAAYVFSMPLTGWASATQTAELTSTAGRADDFFGSGVAIDGTTIVVGAQDHADGAVDGGGLGYLYTEPDGGWKDAVQNRKLEAAAPQSFSFFGAAHAISISGGVVAIGAPSATTNGTVSRAGVVSLFTEPVGGWGPEDDSTTLMPTADLTEPAPVQLDAFGDSVSLAAGAIAVGAPEHTVGSATNQGAAYLFAEPPTGWTTSHAATIVTAPQGAAGDSFGTLALGTSGLLVGAPEASASAGAAYLFAPARPALTKVTQAHKSWLVGSRSPATNPAHPRSGGTRFSFTLNEAATVTMAFTEKNKHAKYVAVRSITLHAKAGTTREYIDGKLGRGKKLAAGHCRVVIAASNANGRSIAHTLAFTVTAAKH